MDKKIYLTVSFNFASFVVIKDKPLERNPIKKSKYDHNQIFNFSTPEKTPVHSMLQRTLKKFSARAGRLRETKRLLFH